MVLSGTIDAGKIDSYVSAHALNTGGTVDQQMEQIYNQFWVGIFPMHRKYMPIIAERVILHLFLTTTRAMQPVVKFSEDFYTPLPNKR